MGRKGWCVLCVPVPSALPASERPDRGGVGLFAFRFMQQTFAIAEKKVEILWHLRQWGWFCRFFLTLVGVQVTARRSVPVVELPRPLVSVVLCRSPLVPMALGATLRPHVLANIPPSWCAAAPWRWLLPRLGGIRSVGPEDLDAHGWNQVEQHLLQGLDVVFLLTAAQPDGSLTRLMHSADRVGAAVRAVYIDGLAHAWEKDEKVPKISSLQVHVWDPIPAANAADNVATDASANASANAFANAFANADGNVAANADSNVATNASIDPDARAIDNLLTALQRPLFPTPGTAASVDNIRGDCCRSIG